jgi:two-component system, NarL family, nitrate/nitrite response regulator NarL
MQNIFISSGGKLLAHWEEAFADAEGYSTLSASILKKANTPNTVIWLHAEREEDNMAKIVTNAIKKLPEAKIVVLSNQPSQKDAFEAMSAGASGYCHAYSAATVLTEVRSVVIHGGIWLGRELLQQLIHITVDLLGTQSEQVTAALEKLTQRERDVAIEAAKGLSNKEIARILNITERTVKAHISGCFERLHIKDRLQLALILNDKSSRQIN